VKYRVAERRVEGSGGYGLAVPAASVGTEVRPRQFIERGRLLAAELREAVWDWETLARGPGRMLYRYRGGVWRPDGDQAVQAVVAQLMGDDYRPTHAYNVIEATAALAPRTITDEPLPDLINFRNGLLYLPTLELLPHSPDVPSLNQLPHDWEPGAAAPRAERFMQEVFPTQAAQLGWEMLGYAMYDGNPLQKAALLLGEGANGKGEYLRIVEAVLGGDNIAAVPLQTLGENRFAAAELFGKLANIAGDLPSAYVTNTATFKKLTGGDVVHAERKFRDPFTFTARAFPMFSANEVPGSEDASYGYLRRWVVVPFAGRFGPSDEPGLTETLAAEAPGIIVRAVEALGEVLARGAFVEPEAVAEAKEDFARFIDPVRAFCEETLRPLPDAIATRHDVYAVYKEWTEEEGIGALSQKRFTPRLRSAMEAIGWGFVETRVGGQRQWEHVKLRRLPVRY
jgi:P4 family phage/plasmid primase-like protien